MLTDDGSVNSNLVSEFTSYFSDNIGGRSELAYLYTGLGFKAFRQSANQRIGLGVDDWFFCYYGKSTYSSLWQDYQNDELPDEIEQIYKDLSERNIEFYFVMPPTKTFVYPEKAYYGNFNGDYIYPTKYITEELNRRGVPAHDLTDAVKQAKAETGNQMWFKYDGHWNDVGSWYGYKELYQYLSEFGVTDGDLPQVSFTPAKAYRADLLAQLNGLKLPEEDMMLRNTKNPQAVRIYEGELWNRLQLLASTYGWRDLGPNASPVSYWQNPWQAGGKRVLLVMDSLFADLSSNVGQGSIAPLLAENVTELVAVWYAYEPDQIDALIEAYKPDVVIYEKAIL